jgi:hypothetical protein
MAATTHLSDLNELSLGYVLNHQQWWNKQARDTFNAKFSRLKGIPRPVLANQVSRGQAMAKSVLQYLSERGLTVVEVHWVARPGTLQQLVPYASKNHPADVLLRVEDHRFDGVPVDGTRWFGVSAKSTNGRGDIGMKSPGSGTLSKLLDVDVNIPVRDAIVEIRETFALPKTAKARKASLRSGPEVIHDAVGAIGQQVLGKVRQVMLETLGGRSQSFLRTFLRTELLDCDSETTWPRYIKVTGFGEHDKGTCDAKIHDPFAGTFSGDLSVEPIGSNGVGFRENGKQVCVLRAKFESEPLASTLKFNVDPK